LNFSLNKKLRTRRESNPQPPRSLLSALCHSSYSHIMGQDGLEPPSALRRPDLGRLPRESAEKRQACHRLSHRAPVPDQATPDAGSLTSKGRIDLHDNLMLDTGNIELAREISQCGLIRNREHHHVSLRRMLAPTAGGMCHLGSLKTMGQIGSHNQVLGERAGVNGKTSCSPF
jgi:hypothetical protein